MNKAKLVHAMSVFFFAGNVSPLENGYLVHCKKSGQLLQAVHGDRDVTLELGGSHVVNGDPIARDSRLFMLDVDGCIKKHPKFDERVEKAKKLCGADKVAQSVSALKKLGYEIDKECNIVAEPKQAA